MSRLPRLPRGRALVVAAVLTALASVGAGCGGELDVDKEDRVAATIFNERCSGCHSLESANSFGSKPTGQLAGGERTNGPNFNVRKVNADDALYAIRNGGFSGAIMPANIVVGEEADALAEFLEKYSGKDRTSDTDIANPSSNE